MSRDKAFNTLMSSVDAPMAIVTTAVGDQRAGCLVGFHAQSSIDPPRHAVWLSKANYTYRLGLLATHFGVHFLTVDDIELATRFGAQTGDDVDKFAGLAVRTGPGGVPLLTACSNRLTMHRVALLDDGGDHVCVTGDVVDATCARRFVPLRLSQVANLDPGHDAAEGSQE